MVLARSRWTVAVLYLSAWLFMSWSWATGDGTNPPLDLQFAYAPYSERMRLLLDASGLAADARLDSVEVEVRSRGPEPAVVKKLTIDRFDDHRRAEAEFRLEGLDGSYEIAARACGGNLPVAEVVKPLVRWHYEWEHNRMGQSTRARDPFTPLVVTRNTVHAVLRAHELNGFGLLDQVRATAAHTGITKPLLAAPMRYVVRTDAGVATLQPRHLRLRPRSQTRVVMNAAFGAAGFEAEAVGSWDADGMLWTELTLRPGNGRALESLVLEVPLAAETTPLLHALAEGNGDSAVSQALPPGEGTVWDAARVCMPGFPQGFCPYVYLGSAVRGLCWFAENDHGWGWAPGTPNLEVVRQAGIVILRVHLVNAPPAITAPRTLAFGLQAAPLKPRVSPWRCRFLRDGYMVLDAGQTLGLGGAAALYPAQKDMYLWQMLRRANQEKLTDQQIEQVFEYGRKYWEPYGPEAVEAFRVHAGQSLRAACGAKLIFGYDRAGIQAADEFQTFADEWTLTDYRRFGPGKGLGPIPILPSGSYIDQALYWYAKSFVVGANQGVCWDNWFVVPSLNRGLTAACRRADGSTVPATGILALRELAKRTFQSMHEQDLLPITMTRLHAASILPLLGFATVQSDGGGEPATGDAQDRFPRERVLLVSTGELAGTWPVLPSPAGKLPGDAWTQRTWIAASLVHELSPTTAAWQSRDAKAWQPLVKPVLELLDAPELQVYRYWDERPQPVTANHPDLPTIVYSVPGREAIVAVTSYARQDVDAILTVAPPGLGFATLGPAVDVETGEALPLTGNRLNFRLRKHDVREFRLSPAADSSRRSPAGEGG